MRVQAYKQFQGTFTIVAATPRPEEAASTKLTAATIHEDYAAKVRALLREYKHIGGESLQWPSAKRIQTYFPTQGGLPLYAIRELRPAGTTRGIDQDFQLEIISIRYAFTLDWLPAAFYADEEIAEAMERNLEFAVSSLFEANSVPHVFIPGSNETEPGNVGGDAVPTSISITCEMGGATARGGIDLPQPV